MMKNVILLTLFLTASCVFAKSMPTVDETTLRNALTSEHTLEDAVDGRLGIYLPWASTEARSIAQLLNACSVEDTGDEVIVNGINCPVRYIAIEDATGASTGWVVSNPELAKKLGVRSYSHQRFSQQRLTNSQTTHGSDMEATTLVTTTGQMIEVASQLDKTFIRQSGRTWKLTNAEDKINFTFNGTSQIGTFSLVNMSAQSEACTLDRSPVNCATLAYILGWDSFHNPFNE